MFLMTSLSQLLVFSAALVAGIATQDCRDIQLSSEMGPLVYTFSELPSQGTVWFRPPDPTTNDLWFVSFHLGKKEEAGGSFTRLYELQLKKPKNKNFLGCKFFQVDSRKSFLDDRFSRDWLDGGMWLGLRLSDSQLVLTFQTSERQLQIQLTTEKEFSGVEAIKLVGDMYASGDCTGPEDQTTTTPSTTSTSTTTTSSTTTTTTTTTEEEEPSTTKSYDYLTSTQDTIIETLDIGDPTASNLEGDIEERVEALGENCQEVYPWWIWMCAGLTAAFLIFFLMLLSYTVFLHRRNWKLTTTVARQGQYLRGRSAGPGGYGVEARDVQYYEMRNHNLMIGDTTPRLVTPSPRIQRRCNTAPRLSPYRRSISNPGTPRPHPTLQFPLPPSKEASPSPYLDQNYLPPPPDDLDEYMYEKEALQGKKICTWSDNGLADDERSVNTLEN